MSTLKLYDWNIRQGLIPIDNGGIRKCNMVEICKDGHIPESSDLRQNEFLAFEFNNNNDLKFYVPYLGYLKTCFYIINRNGVNIYKIGIGPKSDYDIKNINVELVKITVEYTSYSFKINSHPHPNINGLNAEFKFYYNRNNGNNELLFVNCNKYIQIPVGNFGFKFCYPKSPILYVRLKNTSEDITYDGVLEYHNTGNYISFDFTSDKFYTEQLLIFIMTEL